MTANNWLVYMILTSDGQVYTGITTDMARRWREHSTGKAGARYFRGRQPVTLGYLETAHTRASASQREYALKKLTAKNKRELIKIQSEITQEHIRQLGLEFLIQQPEDKKP